MAGGKSILLLYLAILFWTVYSRAHSEAPLCGKVLKFPSSRALQNFEMTPGMKFNTLLRELKKDYVIGEARPNGRADVKIPAILEYTAQGYSLIIGSNFEVSVPDVTPRENYYRELKEDFIYGQIVDFPPARYREEIKFKTDGITGAKFLVVMREDLNGQLPREMYKISLTNKTLNSQ